MPTRTSRWERWPQLSTDFAEGRRMVYEKVVADLEDVVAWYKQNDPNNRPHTDM